MTDDTPAPVVSLADRRKPVTITPASHLHVGFRTHSEASRRACETIVEAF